MRELENCACLQSKLQKLIRESGKSYDLALIQKAMDIAIAAHNGQRRHSGEEYICHSLHRDKNASRLRSNHR